MNCSQKFLIQVIFEVLQYSPCRVKLTTKRSLSPIIKFKTSVFFFFDTQISIVAHYFPNRFMDEIQEKMVGMEEEASIVKDLYELMEKYQVPVSPEEHAVYQVGG